ncbi:MAG: hypothetical protein M3439_05310 [Chloroflexota bacterium]|nr:hypothetical protein [Chloroflexota bacterium]
MDSDVDSNPQQQNVNAPKGWAARNPKLSILLIAGVFYIILFSMCAFVLILLLRS